MTAHDALDEFVLALNNNPGIAYALNGQLEGSLVPTDKSRTTFFIALAVWMRHDAISHPAIARIAHECAKSVRIIPELADLSVLQIIISAKYPSGESERIVRIIIDREAYHAVESDDLNYRLPVPATGVRCGWYIPQDVVQALP